jgi:hypothetical protein
LAERILTGKILRLRLKASFDRFNSKFTRRRKEMVNFRRVITVLAVLALFTGLAFAQQEQCTAQATSSTPLRGEGFTEQTGDILITCQGGIPITPGNSIPLVNVTVFYNTTVTSRLLPSGSATIQSSNNTSEALLMIDEPNTGVAGSSFGSQLGMIPCTTPLTGCAAWVSNNSAAGSYQQAVNGPVAVGTGLTPSTPAANVYQGVVNGNSVTFYGVPVLPPTTVSASRVYRITNVRVNAQALAGGSASGASPVQSSIVISGSASLPISNPAPVVGYVSNGLTASASGASGFNQCATSTRSYVNTLTFQENFGTAFKTRVAAQTNTAYAGQLGVLPQAPTLLNQDTPGGIYNSESNFVYSGAFGANGNTAGLADFGTRLKATFNNIPAGVRIFVSTANVLNGAVPAVQPAIIGGSAANANVAAGYVGYALLINGETTSDGSTGPGAGFFPSVSSTDNATGPVGISEVSLTNGTGTAVWEVINTNPNTSESFLFGVYTTYVASTATNTPLPGTSTVNLSYAPTATSGAASASLTLPRFAGDSSAARNILTINICRTILLYPYVTNQAGFDTGLTVANTSQDSFTVGSKATGAQAGSCTFTYYGGTTAAPTTPPAATSTGNIAAGTVWANTVGTIAPNFQGYAFAVCNFQYAHGFAFISDVGARNLAMGYLALVIPDPGTNARPASPGECVGVSGCNTSGEQDSH